MKKNYQNMNFENFNKELVNDIAIKIIEDYTEKCIAKKQTNGLIITGTSGVGKTHLAAAIANKLIEKRTNSSYWKAYNFVK